MVVGLLSCLANFNSGIISQSSVNVSQAATDLLLLRSLRTNCCSCCLATWMFSLLMVLVWCIELTSSLLAVVVFPEPGSPRMINSLPIVLVAWGCWMFCMGLLFRVKDNWYSVNCLNFGIRYEVADDFRGQYSGGMEA